MASPAASQASQRRAFTTVFLIEMWERFGFYGMQVLMVTYMIKKLGFVDTRANLVWGAAAALIYATPAIGGWIGDKLLGTRRTMRVGALVLALGYALLWLPTNNEYFLYFALGVIIVGNGLFKPNSGNLVRKIYEGDDTRIDSAFTIYYMAVNIGSMISMTLTPWIRDYVGARYGDSAGWHTAFGVCSIGLMLGPGQLPADEPRLWRTSARRRTTRRQPRGASRGGGSPAAPAGVGLGVHPAERDGRAGVRVRRGRWSSSGYSCRLIRTSQRDERAGLIAALMLVVQIDVLLHLLPADVHLAEPVRAEERRIWISGVFGWHLFTWIPEQYQNLNSIWIVILSPVLVFCYNRLAQLRPGPADCGQVRDGLRGASRSDSSSSASARERGRRQGVVVEHGLGLRLVFARGAAGQRPGAGDDRPLRSGADGRLHDGRVLPRHRHFPVPGQRGRQFRPHPREPHQSGAVLAIYTRLFNELGFAGIFCTLVAVVMLPLMHRLSRDHAREVRGAAAGTQAV